MRSSTSPASAAPKQSASERPATHQRANSHGLLLIGVFKLIKGLLLVGVGIGAVRLLHKDIGDFVVRWINILRVDPDNKFLHGIIVKLFAVTPKQLEALSIGTFFYAALLLTEGVGLLLMKHWAEYFTVISTAALIPLELYELAKHFTIVKLLVLALNAAIVWYLVARLRGERKRSSSKSA